MHSVRIAIGKRDGLVGEPLLRLLTRLLHTKLKQHFQKNGAKAPLSVLGSSGAAPSSRMNRIMCCPLPSPGNINNHEPIAPRVQHRSHSFPCAEVFCSQV